MDKAECHLLLGHSQRGFKWYNPYIMADMMNIKAGSLTLDEARVNARRNAILS